jgi:signal transduction histidine kinase
VIADAAGLTRVVINLLTNAAEASAPGDTIAVTVEQVDADQVMLAVADQGCGIPETVIDRLFDPFFTTKENGTGLGLSIAHRLIEAFGGQLIARNRPEGGAEFVLYLRDGRTLSADASEDSTSRQTTAA